MRKAAALLALAALASPANAIVVVEKTWRDQGGDEEHWQRGFSAHEALAAEPQFNAMVAVSSSHGKAYGYASGVWIGNREGHGYILTAAHVVGSEAQAGSFAFRPASGAEFYGERAWVHPQWFGDISGGVDLAIVRLNAPIEDLGPAPVLYSGRDEQSRRAVLVGYGTRGVAPYGHGFRFAHRHYERKAAAENVVDIVTPTRLTIDLDQPDGPGKNRFGDSHPISQLEGLLAPGDSGGSLWMQVDGGWRIAGVNSSGDPGADYQDISNFTRVSAQRAWINRVFPDARFAGDKTD